MMALATSRALSFQILILIAIASESVARTLLIARLN